jgi:hypothetical protein
MRKLFCLIFILLLATSAYGATLQISGTTNTDDTHIRSTAANTNYGTATTIAVASVFKTLIKTNNLSGLLPANATITSCVCSLYVTTNTADGYIYAYRVLKPWTETGATWNDWVTTDYEWTTVGCMSAADSVDNSGDGVRPDRWATPAGDSVNVTTVNTWYGFSVGAALAQGWYDGTIANNGILLTASWATPNNTFASSEYTTDATKIPFWTITYTVPITNTRRPALIKKMLK